MKKAALFVCVMSLIASQAIGQTVPAPTTPTTPLPPPGALPLGVATNLAVIAPIVGVLGALGAVLGGSSSATTTTVSTD